MSDVPYNDRFCPECRGSGRSNIGTSAECECFTCMGTGHVSTKMDMFQGCRHYVGSTGSTQGDLVSGYPRIEEHHCHHCNDMGYYHDDQCGKIIKVICPFCDGKRKSTTEPRKTWLDECAFYALNGTLLSEIVNETTGPITAEDVARNSYMIASAMLAEKIRREAKE